MKRILALGLVAALAAACAAPRPAPVVDRLPIESVLPPVAEPARPAPEPPQVERPIPTHAVKRGETLVGIALQYGLDYRELAAWNNIVNPNVLSVGQVLVVAAPAGARPIATPVATPLASAGPPIEARPLANAPNAKVEPRGLKVPYSDRVYGQMSAPEAGAPVPEAPVAPVPTPPVPPPVAAEPEKPSGTDREDVDWMWPAKGKVLATFSELNKGTDIGGKKGAPVVAAAGGKVIYAGDGVRGYGKLVIIKHNNTWVTAYAHNDKLLVEDRQEVRKGQRIAEMGQSDTDQVKLHFEMRREGRPVDPAKLLPPM